MKKPAKTAPQHASWNNLIGHGLVFLFVASICVFFGPAKPTQADDGVTPNILAIPNQQLAEGEYLYLTITAEDPNCGNQGPDDFSCAGDTLTFTVDNMPLGASLGGMTIDNGTPMPNTERQRRMVWLPLPSQAGQAFPMTVHVTDQAGHQAATQTFSATVTDRTGPPVLTAPTSRQVFAGEPLAFVVAAQDFDYPAESIQLSAANLPSGAEFHDYGTGVGLFRWQTTSVQAGLNPSVVFTAHSGSDTVAATVPITVSSAPVYQNISACGDVYTNVRVVAPLVTSTSNICLNVKADNIIIDGNNQPIDIPTGSERQAVSIMGHSGVTIKNVVSNYSIRSDGNTNQRITIHDTAVSDITNFGGDDVAVIHNTLGTFLSEGLYYGSALRTAFLDNTVTSAGSEKATVEFIGSEISPLSPITNSVVAGNTLIGTYALVPDEAKTVMRIRQSRGNVVSDNTITSTGTRLGLYIRDQSNDTLYENNTFESESAESFRTASGNANRTLPAGNIFRDNKFISRTTLSDRWGCFMPSQYANTYSHNTFWLNTIKQFYVAGTNGNTFDHNTFYLGSNFYWTYRSGPPADIYTNNIFSYSADRFFENDGFALNRYNGDHNIFFNRSGAVMFSPPQYTTLDNWRQQNTLAGNPQDVHSLETNPLLVDPENGNFSLQSNSPARGQASDGSDIGAFDFEEINYPPNLLSIGSKTIHEQDILSFTVTATDANIGNTLTLTASNLPAGAIFTDHHDRTATFAWTPTADQAGIYSGVHFEVSDGITTDTEDITITVLDGTSAPPVAAFTAAPISGTAPLTVDFTDQSTNTPTAWSWVFGDAGTSTVQNPSHIYSTPNTYTVSLTATNSNGSDGETRTRYVRVRAPKKTPRFPIATGDKTIYEQETLSFNVLATGDSPSETLTLSASNLPTGAIFTDNGGGSGTFSWTPTSSQSDVYPDVNFEVSDGTNTDTEAIIITVLDGTAICIPSWSCSDWSACADSLQTRFCTDTNNCGSDTGRPVEAAACDSTAPGVVTDLSPS